MWCNHLFLMVDSTNLPPLGCSLLWILRSKQKTMLKMCFLFSNTTIVYIWRVRRHAQQEMPAKITQFCGELNAKI